MRRCGMSGRPGTVGPVQDAASMRFSLCLGLARREHTKHLQGPKRSIKGGISGVSAGGIA